MKRNKEKSKAMRGGKSPYAKYGKRPCVECQRQTAESRQRAQRGQSFLDSMGAGNG